MASQRFNPYVPAQTDLPELSLRAIVLGIPFVVEAGGMEPGTGLRLTPASPILGSPFDGGTRIALRRLM